jgi:hypothetical protein
VTTPFETMQAPYIPKTFHKLAECNPATWINVVITREPCGLPHSLSARSSQNGPNAETFPSNQT